MLLAPSIGRTRHNAPDEDEAPVVFQRMTGAADQRVLADPRGSYDKDK
jgi:hypothetical protein